MKPFFNGLISASGVVDPFDSTPFDVFPFPQLIRGAGVTLLAGEDELQSVDESDWSLTDITMYDSADMITESVITAGGVWHFIDLQEVWLLLNGACTVFKPGFWKLFGEPAKVLVQSAITVGTGCSLLGRVLLGGFDPDDFVHIEWSNAMEYWAKKLPYAVDPSLQLGGTNFVWWSTIGGGDVFHIFYPDLALQGLIKEDESVSIEEPLFMDLTKRNERGLMPMPWQGVIHCIKPLGKGAMVYGDAGIAYIFPVTDPIATMGVVEVMRVGIAGRGAVGGDDKKHVFIDTEGALWYVGNDIKPERLGYKEYLEPMLGSEIAISYDKMKEWFYISGVDSEAIPTYHSYVLTKQGLGECPQVVTSGVNLGADFVGVFDVQTVTIDINEVPTVVEDTEVLIVSEVVDFGNRDMKTITTVELSMEIDSDTVVSVAVDSRLDSYGTWIRSAFKQLNTQGWVRVQQTAVEFRFVIKADTYVDTRFDAITVHYQQIGKRTIRGIGTNVASQQGE